MKGAVPQQFFTDQCDTDLDECLVEEFYFSNFPRPNFLILDQTTPKNIYGEPADLAAENAYTLLDPPMPIFIQLDPEEELLDRYGYDRKREAVAWFSAKILRDRNIQPKVGDRIECEYSDALGGLVVEHFIINEISPTEFFRQSRNPYQYNAA
ncbi:MAG: hypothetical protein MJA83_17715, partial [Gammaproteobacteria bacterium]|nr:hypothetical protein [Gammaproteobacteria bacterium]